MKKVIIHTDGSCLGNPGAGGWGAILRLAGTQHVREISGGYRLTTNNRMEIIATLEALAALKEPCEVELYSDSQYLCDSVNKHWLEAWQHARWIRRNKPVPNADLWLRLLKLMQPHQISLRWLRGHAGHPDNERCDYLARSFAQRPNLPPDEIYEKLAKNGSASGSSHSFLP